MKNKKIAAFVLAMAIMAVMVTPVLVAAQEDQLKTEIKGYIDRITGFLAWLAGAVAALLIVVAGFRYMTASNPGDKEAIVSRFKNLIIGLVVVSFASAIATFLIPS